MDKRWRILFVTSIGVFVASLDLFIVNIAFPEIAREYSGASIGDLSWILNAYAIVFAALLVPAGRLADRIGRKRMFLAGMATFTLASALCAAAPSVETMVVARVLQAAGGAMIMPSTLGLILPAFPVAQRAVAVGIWSAVGGVAAALGPPLGGLLVELDWRWIFIVNVPIGIATILAGRVVLSEVRERAGAVRPDTLGVLLLAASIALLTGAIVQGPEWGWGDARVLAAFAGAALGIVAFARRSSRHPAPVIEPELVRIRSVVVANAATMVFFAGFAAMLLASVIFLTGLWGYSILTAGLAIAPGPLTAAITAAPAGRLTARVGPRLPAMLGGLFFAVGFAWAIGFVGAEAHYVTDWLPGFVLGGVGVGLVLPSLPTAATAPLPADRFATGTAVFSMSRQIGSALGVAILVAIVGDASGADLLPALDRAWAFALGAGLATTGIALALPGRAAEARTQRTAAVEPAGAESGA
jgi:EmrB/QacA subfamily drug resistance transporter